MHNLTVRLDQRTKGIEEPSVAVQLLLVLLLQTEDDLNGASTLRYLARICDNDIRSISIGEVEQLYRLALR